MTGERRLGGKVAKKVPALRHIGGWRVIAPMQITTGWIAVDWGTTNRRAFLFDGNGTVIDRLADDAGVLSVAPGGFPAAVEDIRAALGDLPLLMAGMIGSNRGWVEAPYLPCPLSLTDLAHGLCPTPDGRGWIVPGASHVADGRHDVMRGEEVQLLGAVTLGLAPPDRLICHPGTHAKWAWLADGVMQGFRTVMTGELFALLRDHSLLAPQLEAEVVPDVNFLEGVDRALAASELSADLFAVRARALLSDFPPERASAYTSGLLIGTDVRIGLAARPDHKGAVTLIGTPVLTRLYAAAAERAGARTTQIDGEAAFLAGIKALAETMQ